MYTCICTYMHVLYSVVFVCRRDLVLKWLRCGGCCEVTLMATRKLSLLQCRDCLKPIPEG